MLLCSEKQKAGSMKLPAFVLLVGKAYDFCSRIAALTCSGTCSKCDGSIE